MPGVIDAWYILLDRWGTMTFAQVLEQAIDVAENGFPMGDGLARAIAARRRSRNIRPRRRSTSRMAGARSRATSFATPTWRGRSGSWSKPRKQQRGKGRHEALQAARDRFYKGDIARDHGGVLRSRTAACSATRISRRTPPRSKHRCRSNYRGYEVYKNPSATQGPAELFALNILEGYDLKTLGHNSADYIHTSAEALKLAFADREKYLGDTDFVKIPYEGLLSKDYARERRKLIDPDTGVARTPARQSPSSS